MRAFPAESGALRDRRGISAMEFAFIAPILLTLMLGAADIGSAVFQYLELNQALRAGGQYAISHPADITNIVNVATTAATDAGLSAASVDRPTYFCSCDPDGTSRLAPVDCTSPPASCGSTDQFVRLTGSQPYSYFMFNASNRPGHRLGATYVARFQ